MFPTVDVLQCVDVLLVLLAGTLGDALITGCANGQLYVWSGTKVRRVVSERCWMRVGTDACWWCTSTDHNMKRHEKT